MNTGIKKQHTTSSVSSRQLQFKHVNVLDRNNEERYGLSEADHRAIVADCEESVRMCEDIHYYLTNTPDVANYLFF